MSFEQLLVFGILAGTVGMFLWGRWRHDMVAAGETGVGPRQLIDIMGISVIMAL